MARLLRVCLKRSGCWWLLCGLEGESPSIIFSSLEAPVLQANARFQKSRWRLVTAIELRAHNQLALFKSYFESAVCRIMNQN
jgi:hypothetical protein